MIRTLTTSFITLTLAAGVQANVVSNGGFVNGTDWTISGTASASSFNGATRATDGDGWYLPMATGNSGSPTTGVAYQVVDVTAGQAYDFSFDYRRNGNALNVYVDVFDGAVNGADTGTNAIGAGGLDSATLASTTTYTRYAQTFTPTGSQVTVRLSDIGNTTSSSRDIWTDNLQMHAVIGAEADTFVQNGSAVDNGANALIVVKHDTPVGSVERKGLVRFDISSMSIDPLRRSLFTPTLKVDLDPITNGAANFYVFGLNEAHPDELFSESIIYADVNGLDSSGDGTNNNATLWANGGANMGSFNASTVNGEAIFSSGALTRFLLDDTNDKASLLLTRQTDSISLNTAFASREHTELAGPRLALLYDDATFFRNGGLEDTADNGLGGTDGWFLEGNVNRADNASRASEGSAYLGFNSGNSTPNGIAEQTFLAGGGLQLLEFDIAKFATGSGAARVLVELLDAETGADIIASFTATASGGSLNYTTFDAEFLHTGAVLLRFTDTSANNGSGFDTYVDAVSITVIPTPAALPAGLTLFCVVAMRRRRK